MALPPPGRPRHRGRLPRAVGRMAVGRMAVGCRAVGSRAVGRRAVGSRAVGSRAVGSRAVGCRAIGCIAVGAILLAGCSGAKRPSAAAGAAPPDGATASRVAGFAQVAYRVRSAGTPETAQVAKLCALYAYTNAQHDQGLMHRRDLAGYDGMLFKFDQPSTAQFYMKDTLIPLSIAWFDASGRYVSATDMTPCPPASAACPLYGATAAYTIAIEVPEGQLGRLGIAAGSTISVGGAC